MSSTSIDLTSLRTLETDELHVRHPVTDELTGWVITFAGPGHPKTLELQDEFLRRRLKADRERELSRKRTANSGDNGQTPSEMRSYSMDVITGRILTWSPDVSINGDSFSFSPQTATKLLSDPNMRWLFDQCSNFLFSSDSFFPKQPTS